MKNVILLICISLLLLSSCSYVVWDYGDYGGKAVGVVEKINDSTADYGMDGIYTPNDKEMNSIKGKFRFSKANRFNSAIYEGDTITIPECMVSYQSDSTTDWVMLMDDYISN